MQIRQSDVNSMYLCGSTLDKAIVRLSEATTQSSSSLSGNVSAPPTGSTGSAGTAGSASAGSGGGDANSSPATVLMKAAMFRSIGQSVLLRFTSAKPTPSGNSGAGADGSKTSSTNAGLARGFSVKYSITLKGSFILSY